MPGVVSEEIVRYDTHDYTHVDDAGMLWRMEGARPSRY